MDEVVRVVQEDIGQGKGVLQLSVADEGHGADNADALLPEGFAVTGQVVEQGTVFVQQPFAQQGITAQVHQVPIVDVRCVRQIEVYALFLQHPGFLCRFFSVVKDFYQSEQGRQSHFMVLGTDTFLQFRKDRLCVSRAGCMVIFRTGRMAIGRQQLPPACLYHRPRHRYLDSQELIALAILAGTGLEKARKPLHLRWIGTREHSGQQRVHIGSL